MQIITTPPKFQVMIPTAMRRAPSLQSSQKMQIIRYGERIELIPIKTMRGFLRGIDTDVPREADRV